MLGPRFTSWQSTATAGLRGAQRSSGRQYEVGRQVRVRRRGRRPALSRTACGSCISGRFASGFCTSGRGRSFRSRAVSPMCPVSPVRARLGHLGGCGVIIDDDLATCRSAADQTRRRDYRTQRLHGYNTAIASRTTLNADAFDDIPGDAELALVVELCRARVGVPQEVLHVSELNALLK